MFVLKNDVQAYLIHNKSVSTIPIKIMAQKEYCKETGAPHFAPASGMCWSCNRQIYNEIDVVRAANSLITGCPYCHRSYCD